MGACHINKVYFVLLITVLLGAILVVHSKCDGECVKLDECKSNVFGSNLTELRIDVYDEEEDCHYLEVCCDKDDVTKPQHPNGERPNPEEFIECGIRNKGGIGFKMKNARNNESEFGEFPWMVAIWQIDLVSQGRKYIGGGSLIKPNVVLTAAHRVANSVPDSLVVRAGDWDTATENELLPYQERWVRSIEVQPGYMPSVTFNNIALLLMEEAFQPNKHIQLICLPPQKMVFRDQNCFATGWGKTRPDSSVNQAILKKIELPMVDNTACETALRTTRLGPRFRLHTSMHCAGGKLGVDTCAGDGGSPLVCPIPGENDRYYQAGIVSWGIGCGEDGIPGVYARNSIFTDWINEKILLMGADENVGIPDNLEDNGP